MADREKVIKGLQCIIDGTVRCESCGYAIDKHGHHSCQQNCASEAIALLKEQEDLGEELTNAVELIRKKNKRIEELLKEQEAIPPVRESDGDPGELASWWYVCGACRRGMDYHDRFCRHCGKKVKWVDY